MQNLMEKAAAIIVGISLLLVLGCADASAATSTYLPVDEPCPFDEDEQARESLLELPDPLWEFEESGGEETVDDDELEREFEGQFADGADESGHPGMAGQQGLININRAGVDELTELPGIGPALAERIVEYRQHRRFDEPSQLTRVQGIGPATWERIRSLVTVE